MRFKLRAVATAIVTAVLGLAYLAAGSLLIGGWGIEPTDGALLFGRRIGAVYVGFAVMFFLARSAPASVARTALAAGAVVVTSALALLGVLEFAAGHAGAGIFASAAVELALAIGYVSVLLAEGRGAPAA